jgi:hypothetical protein
LVAGIDRIHELGEELASLPVDRRADICRVLNGSTRISSPTWLGGRLFPDRQVRVCNAWATAWFRALPTIAAAGATPCARRLREPFLRACMT